MSLVSSPDIYVNEWASFSTREFAGEPSRAQDGDIVRIVMLDVEDRRPVEDVLCADAGYRERLRARRTRGARGAPPARPRRRAARRG